MTPTQKTLLRSKKPLKSDAEESSWLREPRKTKNKSTKTYRSNYKVAGSLPICSYHFAVEHHRNLSKRERFEMEIDRQESVYKFACEVIDSKYEGKYIIFYDLKVRACADTFNDIMHIVKRNFQNDPVLVKKFHKQRELERLPF